MRSTLLLNLISTATASAAADLSQSHASDTNKNSDHANKKKRGGLRGLANGWQKIPGRSSPFVTKEIVDAIFEEEGGGQDDGNNIVLLYEEEEEGEEDEVVAILFKNIEDEDEFVAGLVNEGHDAEKATVRWEKKSKKKGGQRKNDKVSWSVSEATSVDEASDATDEDHRGKKRGPKKRGQGTKHTKMEAKSPLDTPHSTANNASPTLAPSPDVIAYVENNRIDADAITAPPPSSPPTTTQVETATLPTIDDLSTWTDSDTTAICPPHYDSSTTYAVGDVIEEYSRIYQCQSPPYEAYCNIVDLNESWDDIEKSLWKGAWVNVGDCEKVAKVEAAEAPIAIDTDTTIEASSSRIPPCPSNYDNSKRNYIAGDRVTVKSHIFKCSEETGYEIYCNIAVWNDDLSVQNENAKDMWTDAWEDVGECAPTQEELMEEEAAAGN